MPGLRSGGDGEWFFEGLKVPVFKMGAVLWMDGLMAAQQHECTSCPGVITYTWMLRW